MLLISLILAVLMISTPSSAINLANLKGDWNIAGVFDNKNNLKWDQVSCPTANIDESDNIVIMNAKVYDGADKEWVSQEFKWEVVTTDPLVLKNAHTELTSPMYQFGVLKLDDKTLALYQSNRSFGFLLSKESDVSETNKAEFAKIFASENSFPNKGENLFFFGFTC